MENQNVKKQKIRLDIIVLSIICVLTIIFVGIEVVTSKSGSIKNETLYQIIELGKNEKFVHEEYKFINSIEEYNNIIDEYFESEGAKFNDYHYKNIVENDSEFFNDKKILILYLEHETSDIESFKIKNNEINIEVSNVFGALPDKSFVFIIPVSKNIDIVNIDYSNRLIVRCMDIIMSAMKICAIGMMVCFVYTLIKRDEGYKKVVVTDLVLSIMFVILSLIFTAVTYY